MSLTSSTTTASSESPVCKRAASSGSSRAAISCARLSQVQISKAAKKIDNAALHKALHDRIRSQSWLNDSYINLTVNDGVVELWGFVVTTDQHSALRALVEETDGVNRVEDKLSVAGPLRGGI